MTGSSPAIVHLTVRYLATGGAKRVYIVTAHTQTRWLLCLRAQAVPPHPIWRICPPGTSVGGVQANAEDLDTRLLEQMVWAARRVDEVAPGLCPGSEGFGNGRMREARSAGR